MVRVLSACNMHADVALPGPVDVEHTVAKLAALHEIWVTLMSPQMTTKCTKINVCEGTGITLKDDHVSVREDIHITFLNNNAKVYDSL